MSGCVFKTTYDCDYCEARKVIDQAYSRNKEVDYTKEKGLTKVYIYTKGNERPRNPQVKYKNNYCTCED